MVNSRDELNIEYLRELRDKFLDQGYPIKLINGEFKRALQVDRKDLLFNRTDIAPLVITFSPGTQILENGSVRSYQSYMKK